jgi:predicted DNA-binding ribbon-helix-helix protein
MEPTKTTRSFRINNDIWELLKKEADRRGITASALVTLSITEHISGVLKNDGGLGVTDLIKILASLKQQTDKLANNLDEATTALKRTGDQSGKK